MAMRSAETRTQIDERWKKKYSTVTAANTTAIDYRDGAIDPIRFYCIVLSFTFFLSAYAVAVVIAAGIWSCEKESIHNAMGIVFVRHMTFWELCAIHTNHDTSWNCIPLYGQGDAHEHGPHMVPTKKNRKHIRKEQWKHVQLWIEF